MQDMGETTLTQGELQTFVNSISHRFTQQTYDLIHNNCNHFSNVIVTHLVGHGIPHHIVNLPSIIFSTPGGAMFRPMIESMQSNMVGGGADPFGNNTGNSQTPQQQAVPGLFDLPTVPPASTVAISAPSSFPPSTTTGKIEPEAEPFEVVKLIKPLLSNNKNASIIKTLSGKLLAAAEEKEDEIEVIQHLQDYLLCDAVVESDSAALLETVAKANELLCQWLGTHSSLRVACLFLLRLLAIHPAHLLHTDCTPALLASRNSVLNATLQLLHTHQHAAIKEDTPLSTSQYCVAMSIVSNYLSNLAGQLIDNDECAATNMDVEDNMNTSVDAEQGGKTLIASIVDVAVKALTSTTAEARQMSAAMLYNLVLQLTSSDTLASTHHFTLVQVVCAVLENIEEEKDLLTIHRRLAVACMVVRCRCNCDDNSAQGGFDLLLQDLGYENIFRDLCLRFPWVSLEDSVKKTSTNQIGGEISHFVRELLHIVLVAHGKEDEGLP